jgi:hypothetical protein
LSKIDQNFWEKEKSLVCMGRNHILFKLDFGENSPAKRSLEMNWFGFSQNIVSSVPNPSAHILDQVVLLCISISVDQFHIIFSFLV